VLPKALLRAVKDDLVHELDSHHFQFGVRIPARPEQQIESHLDKQKESRQRLAVTPVNMSSTFGTTRYKLYF
jgi:hypothetical protein